MADRAESGHFKPGHSVKSPGRPIGPSRAEMVVRFLEPHREEVLQKLVDLAKLGDPSSMKLVVERLCPPAKPDSERVTIPNFAQASTLQEKAEAVLSAAANGHCSAEAAQRLLSVLDLYQRTVTATDHERRLGALESGRGGPVLELDDLA